MSKLNIDDKKCVHCGACTAVCKVGALRMKNEDWALAFNEALCTHCNTCLSACPLRAIVSSSI